MHKTKLVWGSILALVIIAIMPAVVHAQMDFFFGQEHKYSVVMRGNGEAVVTAKLIINNNEDVALNNVEFEIPGANITDLIALQQILPDKCIEFSTKDNTKCVKYGDPDYSTSISGYYQPINAEYQKLKFSKTDNRIKVELKKEIGVSKKGAIVLAYATKSYATKKLGVFHFEFPTIKVDSRVKKSQVSINVDSELFVKAKKSSIDYQQTEGVLTNSYAGSEKAIKSVDLDRTVNNIGSGGTFYKEASSLAPMESLIVKGSYSTKWLPLYIWNILTFILIIGTLVIGLYFLLRFINHRRLQKIAKLQINNQTKTKSSTNKIEASATTSESLTFLSPLIIGYGAVASLSFIVATVALSVFFESTTYSYITESSQFSEVFLLLFFVCIIMFYAAVIFGPALYFGFNGYGWKAVMYLLIWQFAWLLIFVLTLLLLDQIGLFAEQNQSNYPNYIE